MFAISCYIGPRYNGTRLHILTTDQTPWNIQRINEDEVAGKKQKLKTKKIPNKLYIEAKKQTNKWNTKRNNRERPQIWRYTTQLRRRGHHMTIKWQSTKGEMLKRKRNSTGPQSRKVYKRIINERVKKEVETTKTLAGERPGCSTVDHLIVLKQTIKESRNKGLTDNMISWLCKRNMTRRGWEQYYMC